MEMERLDARPCRRSTSFVCAPILPWLQSLTAHQARTKTSSTPEQDTRPGPSVSVLVYQPHFGQASTLVPRVFVIWDALPEPSALIKKISLFTALEHGDRRGVEDV